MVCMVAPTLEASYDALDSSGLTGSPVRILTVPSGGFYRSPLCATRHW